MALSTTLCSAPLLSMRQLCLYAIDDPRLIPLAHLGIERQQDALILGELGLAKIVARSLSR